MITSEAIEGLSGGIGMMSGLEVLILDFEG